MLIHAVYILGYLAAVVFDQTVGGIDNHLSRTVVLLQFEDACLIVLLREAQNILNLRPTKTVDALRIIAHHTDVLMPSGQLPDDGMLGVVRILVLVYKQISKAVAVTLANVGMIAEQKIGVQQQVVKIHHVRLAAAVAVFLINLRHPGHIHRRIGPQTLSRTGIVFRAHQTVLGTRNHGQHRRGFVLFLIQRLVLQNILDKGFAVAGVVNGKRRLETYSLGLGSQNAVEHRMEGAHPQTGSQFGFYQSGNTLAHLTGGLVGKGQRQNGTGMPALLQQIGYLAGQHTRLARSGSGNHQTRTVNIGYSLSLAVVQVIQKITHLDSKD